MILPTELLILHYELLNSVSFLMKDIRLKRMFWQSNFFVRELRLAQTSRKRNQGKAAPILSAKWQLL